MIPIPLNPYVNLTFQEFAGAFLKLLPPSSVLWRGPVLQGVINGICDGVADLHERAGILSEIELDPAQADELIGEWEADYGLPDPCTPLSPTLAQRQAALLAKVMSQGGQSDAYLTAVAAAMGFTVVITHSQSFRAGRNRAGQRLNGPNCDFVIAVAAASGPDTDILECRLRQIAPAGDYLVFTYS